MAAYILSNALFYIKDILPITSGAGATFRISKDLERDLNIETWGVNAFVLLKNSAQIERMLVTCTGGVATIVKRGLEQDGITENANLKKVWWDGSIGYISVKPDDFVALGKLDTAGWLRNTMGTAQNIGATNGSANITVADTTWWANGATITGTGIPGGTTIVSFVPNTSAVLSANFTGTTGTVSVIVGMLQIPEFDTSGNEVKRKITVWSSIPADTDLIEYINPITRHRTQTPYSGIKNALAWAWKYTRSVILAENIAASSVQNPSWQAITSIQSSWLTYGGSLSNPSFAFNSNAGDSASAGIISQTRSVYVDWLVFPMKITNCTFSGTTQYWLKTWLLIQWIKFDWTLQTLYTHGSSAWAWAFNINATISDTWYYRWFWIKFEEAWNWSSSLNNVVFTGTYNISALNVMAIVDRILYRNVLWSAAGADQVRAWIRINVPYACKIRNVKSWQVTSSSSWAFLILDSSGNILQTTNLTTGSQTADLNYSLAANTEYRIVVNDTANWTWGSTFNYSTLATFQGTFPYILGSVYGADAGTLDNANGYIFTELELDFEWKAYKARANRSIESEFAMFSWFLLWPQSIWASVVLDNNNQTYITGASLPKEWVYYVSNTAWYIDYTKWTVESIVWYTTSLTWLITGWTRPKRSQVISNSFTWEWFSIPKMWTGWEFDYTLTNNSANTTYLQWSFDKTDWTTVDTWSAASSTSWKWHLPRWYFRVYNPVSTTGSYTIT